MKQFIIILFTLFILLCSCNKKEPVQNSSSSTSIISSEPEMISRLPPVVISSSSSVSTSSLPVSSVPQQQPSKIVDFPVTPAAQPKEITGVSLLFENVALDPSALGQIFFYSGRLYLDSGSFLSSLQPKTEITGAILVDPAAGSITVGGNIEKFSQPAIKVGDKNYFSLYDLSKTLHLEIKINSSSNSVCFYKRSYPPVTEHILSGEIKV